MFGNLDEILKQIAAFEQRFTAVEHVLNLILERVNPAAAVAVEAIEKVAHTVIESATATATPTPTDNAVVTPPVNQPDTSVLSEALSAAEVLQNFLKKL